MEFKKKKIYAIVGPNGCGKTTLFNKLFQTYYDQHIFYVKQNDLLIEELNVYENLKFCHYDFTNEDINTFMELERIKALKDTPDIKIITGIRRSGKSNLMQAYIDYLKSDFEDVNIIFIDYMDLDFEEIKEYHALHKFVEDNYDKGKKNYLFVDDERVIIRTKLEKPSKIKGLALI